MCSFGVIVFHKEHYEIIEIVNVNWWQISKEKKNAREKNTLIHISFAFLKKKEMSTYKKKKSSSTELLKAKVLKFPDIKL